MHNRLTQNSTYDANDSLTYAYDSAYRLIEADRPWA